MDARAILIYLDIFCEHDWDKTLKMLNAKDTEVVNEETDIKLLEYIKKGYKTLTILDADYPQRLKEAYRPPFVIYYKCSKKDIIRKYLANLGSDTKLKVFLE